MINWTKLINKNLKGKTIKNVRYLTDKEMEGMMIYKRPIAIFFTDGNFIVPMSDDEGNDGGAMFTSFKDLDVIPVDGL
jgi:hypothetical protein